MKWQRWYKTFVSVLGSRKFFYCIIGLLIFQALWLALSARYPMAFDENFHFGLIQVYGGQLSPFITEAPPGSGPLGALTREPSYLFAYLMSFPYRLIAWITPSIDAQITFLRLINIGLFAAGLIVFRKLLLITKASPALVHFSLLTFIFIPIVPFLAAHINYDNLLFLLVPIVLLLALSCTRALRTGIFPVQSFILLASLCFVTSLVKYPFLPVAAAIVLYLLGAFFWKRSKKDMKAIIGTIPREFMKIPTVLKVALIGFAILGAGLFIERYGVNYISYGGLVPDCAEVLSFEHCSQYGPWIRNYELIQHAPAHIEPNILYYAANWVYDMSYRLFFAINSDYTTMPPLVLPFVTALVVAVVGTILVMKFFSRLVRAYTGIALFASIIALYTATLFVRGYIGYLTTGEFLALNGRYFIPIMPLLLIMVGLAFREWLIRFGQRSRRVKMVLAAVALLLFLQGGGLLTFIVRSDRDWYRDDATVVGANTTLKHVVQPFVVGKDIVVPFSN